MSKPTVDLLIKDLDDYALMDIMNIIHQYELKYSVNQQQSTTDNNDFRFQNVMKHIVKNNTILHESMQSLVEEYSEHVYLYELGDLLIEKCESITYMK
jgi:hypothetical protein